MSDIKPDLSIQGALLESKFTLDPEKLGMMNKIGWQKYITPENTAFVMVDHDNAALSPNGILCKIGASPMWEEIGALENTLKLVKAARTHNMKIYWLRFGYYGLGRDIRPDSPHGEWLAMLQAEFPGAFLRGSWDRDTLDELKAVMEPQDIIIDKTTFNGFIGTNLAQCLTLEGIKNIILCGIVTDNCVSGTARTAFDMGYYPLVVADATVCNNWETQYHTLYWFSEMIATVVMADEIVDVLQRNSLK
ncbi:cysteine hydrolase family protein [Chloroflexota bacterium]